MIFQKLHDNKRKTLSFAYGLSLNFNSGFVRKDSVRVWPTIQKVKRSYCYETKGWVSLIDVQDGALFIGKGYVQWVGNSFPDPDNSLLSYTDLNP